jgi:Prion-inhibition and propagation
MAEIAGLFLGLFGINGLFSACIESFDIAVSGKNFSDDYEQLCALVGRFFQFLEVSTLVSLDAK